MLVVLCMKSGVLELQASPYFVYEKHSMSQAPSQLVALQREYIEYRREYGKDFAQYSDTLQLVTFAARALGLYRSFILHLKNPNAPRTLYRYLGDVNGIVRETYETLRFRKGIELNPRYRKLIEDLGQTVREEDIRQKLIDSDTRRAQQLFPVGRTQRKRTA